MNHWLHGMFTALVTPFDEDAIDYGALERLILWQIAQGADGIVVGTAEVFDSTGVVGTATVTALANTRRTVDLSAGVEPRGAV